MQSLADFVYPDSCLGCGRLVRGGLCRRCLESVPRVGPHQCGLCGAPTKSKVLHCRECRGRNFAFDRARQVFRFESLIRAAIHSLKYRGHRSLAESLAQPLVELVSESRIPGALTWIPSSGRRLSERGFDHARLVAEAMAARLEISCGELIVKVRETPPQVGLEPSVRRRNLHGAFACRLPPPLQVFVIDDVFTTGATASEAGRALKAAGAASVSVLCLARSLPASGGPIRRHPEGVRQASEARRGSAEGGL